MKHFLRLLSVLCLLFSVSAARANEPAVSPAERLADLGQGLSYLRVHSLAGPESALRQTVPDAGAVVLDLRYITATDESAAALRTALAGRSAAAPLFILVSPGLPIPVAQVLGNMKGVFTLGIVGSHPEPTVIVKSDAATDRRAYDALEAGTPLDQLISGKVEKERFDEATLVKEFKNGNPDAEPPPGPDPTAAKPAGAPEKVPALVDRVLQRAVHLHHGLQALRRAGAAG
ncbi:MAG: hypothetical protein JWQ83_1354 [Lacunisphaera sp.]|nr:hypothetical protein [Lacunisphaera sp.]MDB6166214.1 hypothetical protein [Lacunisphaera sp.]